MFPTASPTWWTAARREHAAIAALRPPDTSGCARRGRLQRAGSASMPSSAGSIPQARPACRASARAAARVGARGRARRRRRGAPTAPRRRAGDSPDRPGLGAGVLPGVGARHRARWHAVARRDHRARVRPAVRRRRRRRDPSDSARPPMSPSTATAGTCAIEAASMSAAGRVRRRAVPAPWCSCRRSSAWRPRRGRASVCHVAGHAARRPSR